MNQNQLTMTGGDERTFVITVDDEYEGDTARFVVDGLFQKTDLVVGEDDGSGFSVVSVLVDEDDTASCVGRHAHRYALIVDHDGETLTVQRGLFVVTSQVDIPDD